MMPHNVEYSLLLFVLFLIGLSLLSVLNGMLYQRIEHHFLSVADAFEDYLETIHYYRHGREGYAVFKALEPSVRVIEFGERNFLRIF